MKTEISATKAFAFFYRLLVFLVPVVLMFPINCMMFRVLLPNRVLVLILTFLLVSAGYFLQSLYAFITRNKRREVEESYESGQKYFKISYAIVPLLIAGIAAFFSQDLFDTLLQQRAVEAGVLSMYDSDSIIPLSCAISCFFTAAAGSVVWFYPTEALARINMFFPLLAILAIEFVLSLNVGLGSTTMITMCTFVFLLCYAILFNQTYIKKNYHGSVVSVITPQARYFNLSLIALFFLLTGCVFILLAIVLVGIATLVKILLFIAMYQLLYSAEERMYMEETQLEADFFKAVFGQADQAPLIKIIFTLFIAAVVLFLFYIIAVRLFGKNGWFQQLYEKLMAFIDNFLYFFFGSGYSLEKEGYVPTMNYVDEERKATKASIREYEELAKNTGDYADFVRKLNRCRNNNEKIGYAYLVMMKVYRKMNINVQLSDTPRECAAKISKKFADTDIGEITEILEYIKYGEQNLEHEGARILEKMCAVIKRQLY